MKTLYSKICRRFNIGMRTLDAIKTLQLTKNLTRPGRMHRKNISATLSGSLRYVRPLVPTPTPNVDKGFVIENDDVEPSLGLTDFQTVIIACLLTLLSLVITVIIFFAIRIFWKHYARHRDSRYDGMLNKEDSSAPISRGQLTISADELKTGESEFSMGVVTEEDDLEGSPSMVAYNGSARTNHASTNGSIITMTLKNNHLIVETEERNDIVQDSRETTMKYSPSNHDSVFVVEVQQGVRKSQNYANVTGSAPEEASSQSSEQQRALVHHPPAEVLTDGEQVDSTKGTVNTGISQSDLSESSNNSYKYGNQQGYGSGQYGYPVYCGYTTESVNIPAPVRDPDKPVITAAILKETSPNSATDQKLSIHKLQTMESMDRGTLIYGPLLSDIQAKERIMLKRQEIVDDMKKEADEKLQLEQVALGNGFVTEKIQPKSKPPTEIKRHISQPSYSSSMKESTVYLQQATAPKFERSASDVYDIEKLKDTVEIENETAKLTANFKSEQENLANEKPDTAYDFESNKKTVVDSPKNDLSFLNIRKQTQPSTELKNKSPVETISNLRENFFSSMAPQTQTPPISSVPSSFTKKDISPAFVPSWSFTKKLESPENKEEISPDISIKTEIEVQPLNAPLQTEEKENIEVQPLKSPSPSQTEEENLLSQLNQDDYQTKSPSLKSKVISPEREIKIDLKQEEATLEIEEEIRENKEDEEEEEIMNISSPQKELPLSTENVDNMQDLSALRTSELLSNIEEIVFTIPDEVPELQDQDVSEDEELQEIVERAKSEQFEEQTNLYIPADYEEETKSVQDEEITEKEKDDEEEKDKNTKEDDENDEIERTVVVPEENIEDSYPINVVADNIPEPEELPLPVEMSNDYLPPPVDIDISEELPPPAELLIPEELPPPAALTPPIIFTPPEPTPSPTDLPSIDELPPPIESEGSSTDISDILPPIPNESNFDVNDEVVADENSEVVSTVSSENAVSLVENKLDDEKKDTNGVHLDETNQINEPTEEAQTVSEIKASTSENGIASNEEVELEQENVDLNEIIPPPLDLDADFKVDLDLNFDLDSSIIPDLLLVGTNKDTEEKQIDEEAVSSSENKTFTEESDEACGFESDRVSLKENDEKNSDVNSLESNESVIAAEKAES